VLSACRVALSVCRGVPLALDPEYTFTVTVAESPGALPATPEKVGVAVDTVAPFAGWVSVTVGGVVSGTLTVNVFAELKPVLPAASPCCARAVYVPLANGDVVVTE